MSGPLTAEERARFAAYLEESAKSGEWIANESERIGQKVIAQRLRAEAMAEKIVAAKLRSYETQVVE
jgi:hypothetical protein